MIWSYKHTFSRWQNWAFAILQKEFVTISTNANNIKRKVKVGQNGKMGKWENEGGKEEKTTRNVFNIIYKMQQEAK